MNFKKNNVNESNCVIIKLTIVYICLFEIYEDNEI